MSARVLLTCFPGTLKYTYMYPEYGKYTKTYRGILTLNLLLSAIKIHFVHIYVNFLLNGLYIIETHSQKAF